MQQQHGDGRILGYSVDYGRQLNDMHLSGDTMTPGIRTPGSGNERAVN